MGWQLDPFGHSAVQASHLGSGVGFEAVFFGRADRDDVEARVERGAMEFTWRGSPSLGPRADVKGFILSRYGNYGPPPGHCYDQVCADPVWQDNPSLEDYNVPVMVERFEAAVAEQAAWFRGSSVGGGGGGGGGGGVAAAAAADYGGDIMLTMGTDFTYSAAPFWQGPEIDAPLALPPPNAVSPRPCVLSPSPLLPLAPSPSPCPTRSCLC